MRVLIFTFLYILMCNIKINAQQSDFALLLKIETNANFLFRDIGGQTPLTWTGRVGLLF